MTDFIIMTGEPQEEYKPKAEELGVILYVVKPFFNSKVLEPYAGKWNTAMVVDDSSDMREAVKLVLEEYGCKSVSTYPEPHSALEAYKRERPDLVVTDVNMNSDMDGFDLIKAMKSI